jgi:hypothetical protein
VLLAGEQDFGLGFVTGHVVADLQQRQVAALEARADAGQARDRRVVGRDLLQLGGLLGVVVVHRVGRREVHHLDVLLQLVPRRTQGIGLAGGGREGECA